MYEARQNKEKVSRRIDVGNGIKSLMNNNRRYFTINRTPHTCIIQRYITGISENNKLYNISANRELICGIEYPNHELYVKDKGQIDAANETMKRQYIELVQAGEKQVTLDHAGKKENFNYTKVGIKYLKDKVQNDIIKNSMKKMESDINIDKNLNRQIVKDIYHIREIAETVKKLLIIGDIKNPTRDYLRVDTKEKHYLIGINKYKDLIKETFELIENVLVNKVEKLDLDKLYDSLLNLRDYIAASDIPPTDSAISMLQYLISYIRNIKKTIGSTVTHDQMRKGYRVTMEEAATAKEILLPAGCDACAELLGGHSIQFWIKNYKDHGHQLFHYTTFIMNDGNDAIHLEAFAKKNYTFFDNTWEFMMYGDYNPEIGKQYDTLRNEEQEKMEYDSRDSTYKGFKDYTIARYRFLYPELPEVSELLELQKLYDLPDNPVCGTILLPGNCLKCFL